MKKFFASLLVSALAMGALAGCGGSSSGSGSDTAPEIKAIQDRGALRAGVKVDVPKFGYKDPKTNVIDGFEIDLAKAIAKKINGNDKVELTGVTAQTRGPALDNGELDVVIATFTVTEERKKSWNFSRPYFQDAVGLLVKKGAFKSFKDLNGKTIGVAKSATTKKALEEAAAKEGIKVEFLELASYPEIKAALDAGRVQAFSVDRAILFGYLDANTEILPDRFSPQDYGVATKKSNTALAKLIDDLVAEMQKNGEMDKLLQKWGLK